MPELGLRRKKVGGKFLVRGQVLEPHVLDRVAERPMADIVQQGRAQKDLGPVTIDHFAKPRILAELLQIANGVVKHSQRMLEPRVGGSRIDARRQAQLGDVLQTLELRRVDQRADAIFRQAAIPHRLIPPAIALGAFTFTMTALPGTPAIQNAIRNG